MPVFPLKTLVLTLTFMFLLKMRLLLMKNTKEKVLNIRSLIQEQEIIYLMFIQPRQKIMELMHLLARRKIFKQLHLRDNVARDRVAEERRGGELKRQQPARARAPAAAMRIMRPRCSQRAAQRT